jgi:DNA-binding NarL/FixJ family response regulator
VKGLVFEKEVKRGLARAVLAVAGGGAWMPRVLTSRFLDHMLGRSANEPAPGGAARRLSQRERQVLDGVLKSQSNKEIAASLYISESTVKFHLTRLFAKFGVRRRADLILHSIQQPAMVH